MCLETRAGRYLRLFSECPGLHPDDYGHNLTVQDPDFVCSHLTYDVKTAGTFWLAVEGVDDQEGTFEISLTCGAGMFRNKKLPLAFVLLFSF